MPEDEESGFGSEPRNCLVCLVPVTATDDAVFNDEGSDIEVALHMLCEGMLLEAIFEVDGMDVLLAKAKAKVEAFKDRVDA